MTVIEPVWRVVAVHAGRGPDSASRRLAESILGEVCAAADTRVEARTVEVWSLMLPVHRALSAEVWDAALHGAHETIAAADAVVAVTQIVHGGYSGPFKSFVDLMGVRTWAGKLVLIGACGGTLRHSLALEHVVRPLFVCLRSVVLPTAVYAAPEDRDLGARIERAAREMVSALAARPEEPFTLPAAAVHRA